MSSVNKSILLVDDDQEIRELLDTYLTRAGFQVRTTPDGAGFRQALNEAPSDLVILDVMLPELDGWQVLEGQLLAFTAFAFDPDNPYYTPALRDPATGLAVAATNIPRTVSVELLSDLPPGVDGEAEPARHARQGPDRCQSRQ